MEFSLSLYFSRLFQPSLINFLISCSKEIVPIKKKAERRDKIRETKALSAAHIEETIEKELLDRLSAGVYEDIYNFNPKAFEKVMDDKEVFEAEEELDEDEISEANMSDAELVYDSNEDDDDEDDDEDDEDGDDEDLEDIDEDDEEEDEEEEDEEPQPSKKNGKSISSLRQCVMAFILAITTMVSVFLI